MALTLSEARELLQADAFGTPQAFGILAAIGLHGALEDRGVAREMVIRALDRQEQFRGANRQLLLGLVREYGLFPYLDDVVELPLADQIAYEAHRPMSWSFKEDLVFHSEQAMVYERLLAGENVVLSAPTSFGKSLVIDAVLAARDFQNVAIIVPTLSLMDETRRRLSHLGDRYKIITHGTQARANRNLWVMTQERMLEMGVPTDLDFFVIDEFYKLDPAHSDERSNQLNILLFQLLNTNAQFYMLGPNITSLSAGTTGRLRATFISTGFSTVATDIERVSSSRANLPDDLASACREVGPSTLIFCRSPARTREVADWLLQRGIGGGYNLDDAADWIGENYHPDWILAKALRQGIGIHHGRLPRALGHHMVRLFDEGRLPYLLVTSTLIEGVNTSAKNVIILDNVIARKRYDYFTFSNIRGRSGRMFHHFVGRVVVFNPEPRAADLTVDVPVLSQSTAASVEVLIQVPDSELTAESRARLQPYLQQNLISVDTLRDNRGISLDRQINVARNLNSAPDSWSRVLTWSGAYPTAPQVRQMEGLLFELTGSGPAVRTAAQLGARINVLRFNRGNIRAMVDNQLSRSDTSADGAVEDTLDFVRNWAQFKIPTALATVNSIATDVLGRSSLSISDPRVFAGQLENLFLSPFASVLEEYGLPTALTAKLETVLGLSTARSMDDVLGRLRSLTRTPSGLSPFELEMLVDARSAL